MAGSMASATSPPGSSPAAVIALTRSCNASAVVSTAGANPPSSPTAVDSPRSCRIAFSAW